MEVPFALSIHKFVNSVGADAGFAAFVCVAVIGLLHFAQARETASLRERLDDAHGRIGGLEARIAQLMHLQSSRPPVGQQPRVPAPAPGRVTPPPAGARPMGSAIASVRRIPAATATATAVATLPPTSFPAAPAGVGAPALASATKLIPDPAPAAGAASASDDTMFVPGAAVTPAANGKSEAPAPPVPVAGTAPPTETAPATAMARAGDTAPATATARAGDTAPAGDGRGEVRAAATAPRAAAGPPAPPRVQIRPDAAQNASGASRRRRGALPTARPLGEARFDAFERDRGGSRDRRLPLIIAIVAVVVIIGGLAAILLSGGSTTSSTVHTPATTPPSSKSTSGRHGGRKHRAPVFSASRVTVAVLNGTAVNGLAADVAKVLSAAGYRKGSITNAPTQAESTSTVYFMPGYKSDAAHVASQLRLRASSVKAATQAAIQACATTPTSATTSCEGDVIVSVGQDKASLASSASASAG